MNDHDDDDERSTFLTSFMTMFLFFQQMLLQDLYDTKMCNSLLFPEADEDIWKHEDLRMSVSPTGVYISKSDGSGTYSKT